MTKKQIKALKVIMENFRKAPFGLRRETIRSQLLAYLAGCLDGIK